MAVSPDSSFGKSSVNNFLTYGLKLGETFKINGRNYLYGVISYRTRAPFSRFAYLSPRIRDEVVSNLTTEKIAAGEAGYIFRFSGISGRLTAYTSQFDDQIENISYYHDELRTFVNYITSNISKRHSGIELGLNVNCPLPSHWRLHWPREHMYIQTDQWLPLLKTIAVRLLMKTK